ncbi:MAG: hypothetical protein M1827_004448 [Pycnora praestabilis]|nr:MAG: hypothetical protein M1827_004448 [Pycnora praestabilis]
MVSTGDERRSWLRDINVYLVYLLLVTTMGPLQFGFHLAELNTPQAVITCEKKSVSTTSSPTLPQCIPMNPTLFGLVQSIFTLGGLIGALLAGPAAMKYGRLNTMRSTTTFFVIGPVFEALAPSVAVMTVGRLLSGLGAGAAIVVVPIYISETAPPREKGMFGALTQVMVNLGIIIAQLLGLFLSKNQLWRVILGVGGGIGLLQLGGLIGAVESPKWMADHRDPQKARKILVQIRGHKVDISDEVESWPGGEDADDREAEEEALLQNERAQSRNSSVSPDSTSKKTQISFFDVIWHPEYNRAIVAVVAVMLAQQLCGINSIVMYGVSILSTLFEAQAALLSLFISLLNFVVTLLCAPLADKWGRKVCLLISIAGMGINSVLLAVSILYKVNVLSVIAVLLFVASFAIGLGPVPFILSTELVGPEAVGATQSWALAVNWIATFIVAQFFPTLNEKLGTGKVYFLFAGLAALFFAFVAWWVPETKGKKDADEVWGRDRRAD